MRPRTLASWLLVKARGCWSRQPALTPRQWAFAVYHLQQDQLDEAARAHARMQSELALHFLLKMDPEKARKAILDQPLEDPKTTAEDEAFTRLAADPYFGPLGGPELPDFAELFGVPDPPPPTAAPVAGLTFPAFPVGPHE